MTEYTFHGLKTRTVAQLREIASGIEHEAVKGYTQQRKDEIIAGICTALGIDMHEHHVIVGVDKSELKVRIRSLKEQREAALAARDHVELKQLRRRIHHLKRRLHKATV